MSLFKFFVDMGKNGKAVIHICTAVYVPAPSQAPVCVRVHQSIRDFGPEENNKDRRVYQEKEQGDGYQSPVYGKGALRESLDIYNEQKNKCDPHSAGKGRS